MSLPLITIRSDGELEPVTGLMYTDPNTVSNTNAYITDIQFKRIYKLSYIWRISKSPN
ncbi:MAG: hypothetical protein RCG15_04585 [Candidatus Rickettsia vulgarisii]